MEQWLDIPNYDGYQASNTGKIRTHNKITHTNRHGDRRWKDRILKQKVTKNVKGRYDARVELWNKEGHKTYLVARLVAFTFYGVPLENHILTVNHKDGDSLNNDLTNLELITLKENIQHAFRTGLINQTKVKLTDKENGTIIYPSSLSEGGKIIGCSHGYLSYQIKKNIFENDKYRWELINEEDKI